MWGPLNNWNVLLVPLMSELIEYLTHVHFNMIVFDFYLLKIVLLPVIEKKFMTQ